MAMRLFAEKRLGTFHVSSVSLIEEPFFVKLVMSECIILRAEYIIENDSFEYLAWCELFDVMDYDSVVPVYSFTVAGVDLIATKQSDA
jgi:hypothetical protein